LGNISLTVQAWGTVFIIPAAYLIVATYVVSLIAGSIATGIHRSKAICYSIVNKLTCRKISCVETRSTTFSPARIPAVSISFACATTFLTRMFWSTGSFTAIIFRIPETLINQQASSDVFPCHTIVLATNKNPRAILIPVAVTITNSAIGIFVAAMLSTPTIHGQVVGLIDVHHHFFFHLAWSRVFQKG
jgi:hypothetical protein